MTAGQVTSLTQGNSPRVGVDLEAAQAWAQKALADLRTLPDTSPELFRTLTTAAEVLGAFAAQIAMNHANRAIEAGEAVLKI